MFQKDQDITHEAITKKLLEIIAVRGKKGTKRGDQVGDTHTQITFVGKPTLCR